MKRYLMELVGTFFLVLAVSFTSFPLAIGMMLMAMIYVGGNVSGAHYNPVVSLAFWLRGRFNANLMVGYFVAQTVGALLASVLYHQISGTLFLPQPSADTMKALWVVLLIEVLLTFVLCSTILAVVTTSKLRGNNVYGLVIGFTLMAVAFFGGVYNPAIAVGASLYNLMMTGSLGSLNALVVYIIGPSVGAVLAAYFCNYIYSGDAA